jgi:Predicted transmembrane sensor domain
MRLKRPNIASLLEFALARRTAIFCVLTVAVCALLASPYMSRILIRWDYKLIDTRFALRGDKMPDDDVVILSIEETSLDPELLTPEVAQLHPALAKMAKGWPYDRSVYADVINRLVDAGAKLIVFDIVFPRSGGPGEL